MDMDADKCREECVKQMGPDGQGFRCCLFNESSKFCSIYSGSDMRWDGESTSTLVPSKQIQHQGLSGEPVLGDWNNGFECVGDINYEWYIMGKETSYTEVC